MITNTKYFESVKKLFYKYLIYYFVVFLRHEWIWKPRRQLEKSQRDDPMRLEQLQLSKLNRILSLAQTSPYYKAKLENSSLSSLGELGSLPFLEKDDLRLHAKELETHLKPKKFTLKTSVGSTGAPVTVKKPAKAMGQELAATWRGYSWAGIDIGDLQARFWGVPLTKEMQRRARWIDLVTRRIRFSAFKFNSSDLDRYLDKLERKQPTYFYGYTSMIYELALHVIKRNYIGRVRPLAIVTTSEVLTSSIRDTIEQAFQCKVFNEYGCGEVGTIAHECEHGHMHINMENVLVEIVNEQGGVLTEGKTGEIVVTDLNNTYMPLIRYRLRDFGSIHHIDCPCGRTLAVLKDVKGRAYDFIENELGQKFHGEFFLYMVEELKSRGIVISGIQFVKDPQALNVRIASDEASFNTAVSYIRNRLLEEFSKTFPVIFHQVKSIEREASGKLRVIKNLTEGII